MMLTDPDVLDRDESLDGGPDAGDVAPPEEPVESDDGDPDGREPVRWVTVGAFWNVTEAHLARLRVEAEDIDCVLLDEFLVATDWLYANAAGGIKLQVPEADAARARDLITRPPTVREDEEEEEKQARDEASEPAAASAAGSQGECPRCGGLDVYRAWFSRRLFFALFLFGLPLPLPIPVRRCRDCRNEWWRRHERWHRHGRAGFEVVPNSNETPASESRA